MKLVTRDTDYAIQALLFIAKAKRVLVSTTAIENELNLPRPFLRKILQILQKEGVLRSTKGNKGGFILAQATKDISLAKIIEIFQGKITLTDCFLKKKICPRIKKCHVRKKIQGIEAIVISELKKITIASLLECK